MDRHSERLPVTDGAHGSEMDVANLKNENLIGSGTWMSTIDSLSKVQINGNEWIFNYDNTEMSELEQFQYRITESVIDDENVIVSGSLFLIGRSDTLKYKIDHISGTEMLLIYLPRGNFHHYQKID